MSIFSFLLGAIFLSACAGKSSNAGTSTPAPPNPADYSSCASAKDCVAVQTVGPECTDCETYGAAVNNPERYGAALATSCAAAGKVCTGTCPARVACISGKCALATIYDSGAN